MRRFLMLLILCLVVAVALTAANAVEEHKVCGHCGMSLEAFPKNHMQVIYDDGTTHNVCSIHCAAADMKQNKDKQVKSLMVADYYTTGEMIDARTATWVMGGKVEGVMTKLAKWAFADKEEAQRFVKENGGELATFDQAMTAAQEEEVDKGAAMPHDHHTHMGHNMSHMEMGPGSQMTYNPAFGDEVYHVHPEGMWMLNYKFMHMDSNGMRAGTDNVAASMVSSPKGYNYMNIPTNMRMDMQMLMLMYGVTDKLTLMAMPSYVKNSMNMLMDMHMGKGASSMAPMVTSGFGDTEVRGIYGFNKYLNGSLGISLPTGSIDQVSDIMGKSYRAPYDMQLGSGTFDLKPALTYNTLSDDALWNWGAQAVYTLHMGKNTYDYSLGDSLKLTGWLQRSIGPVTPWIRLAFSDTGKIRGQDDEIAKINDPKDHPSWFKPGMPTFLGEPDASTQNYGGQRLDALIGLNFTKGPVSFGIEGGMPAYQRLNGLQMKTDWIITAAVQVMF
ncbi:MAG: nitrous oxide reductase accessory protein NosL [Nitrospirae bacterium]|nr:nitrous oxide reductase accessory protein NosL [Nitrospirota bacterium]MBF0590992.1 nitrous oxide reductase accessory protein NosL [Nitrospirota bacterium]